jgi:tetratricopeptide (TPR) repeat protein
MYRMLGLLVFITTISIFACLYFPVLDYPYIWDDMLVRQARGYFMLPSPLREAFCVPYLHVNYYRPIPVLTMIYETSVAGGVSEWQSRGHLINYVLFLFLIAIVWRLFYLLLKEQGWLERIVITTAACLIVGLHPAVVVGPAWVSARFDLAMTAFIVLLLYAELTLAKTRPRAFITGILFLLAALSKESAIALVIFLPIFHACKDGYSLKSLKEWPTYIRDNQHDRTYIAIALAGIFYLVIRYSGLGYILIADESIPDRGTFLQALLLTGKTFLIYAKLFFWPFEMIAPAYPQSLPVNHGDFAAWTGLFLLIGTITLGLWLVIKKHKNIGWLLLAWVATLLPVLNLKQVPLPDSIADLRYLCMPIMLTSVLTIALLPKEKKYFGAVYPAMIVMSLVWVIFAGAHFKQSLGVWKNELFFWHWYLKTVPSSPIVHLNYSRALRLAGQYDLSIEHAKISLDLYPEQTEVGSRLNIILSQMALGEYKQARVSIDAYLKIVQSPSTVSMGATLMASALISENKLAEVRPWIDKALMLDPRNIRAYVQKIRWLYLSGDQAAATETTVLALRLLNENHLLLRELLSEDKNIPAERIITSAIGY